VEYPVLAEEGIGHVHGAPVAQSPPEDPNRDRSGAGRVRTGEGCNSPPGACGLLASAGDLR
jgi:hypothetical protein